MVVNNPLLRGRWTLKRFNATIVNDVLVDVLFFTSVAVMVWAVSKFTSTDLSISNALLTVLGTVLGLVISFRTSSAYERFQDGRKLWTSIQTISRNLTLMIWIHVPFERKNEEGIAIQSILESAIEKRSYINLIQAFSVAVKHYLRGEPGPFYQDLYPLISFLPRIPDTLNRETDLLPLWVDSGLDKPANGDGNGNATAVECDTSIRRPIRKSTFDPEKALPTIESEVPLQPPRNPPEVTVFDYVPLFRLFRWLFKRITRNHTKQAPHCRTAMGKKMKPELIDSTVPLEICLYLSSYTSFLMKNGLLQPALATGMSNNISALQDTLTNLERVRTTPLPFAYQAHLRMSLWLYLFFLPFQIHSQFGHLTIPATAFASFLLLGFLEIGQEIEDPFGYDANDLDMDSFCLSIQRELHQITAHTSPEPADFVFTEKNQPFAPSDRTNAAVLIRAQNQEYIWPSGKERGNVVPPGMASIRKTLLRSWRDVDQVTRDPQYWA